MSDAQATAHLRGMLLSAAGMTVISPDGVLLKLISGTGLWTIVFYRLGFLAITLGVALALRYRARVWMVWLAMGRAGWLSSLLLGAANLTFVGAMLHTSVADTLLLLATLPFWSALLGQICIGERVRVRTWVAMLVALSGIATIVGGSLGHGKLLGDLLALATAVLQAANLVVWRHAGDRNMLPALCLSGVLAAAVGLVLGHPVSTTRHDMVILAFLGVIQQPLAMSLFLSGTRFVPAAEVALLALVETVLGPIWAWIGVGEVPAATALGGGVIVIGAIFVNSLLGVREQRFRRGVSVRP